MTKLTNDFLANENVRRAEISIRMSQFEIPPMQDVLLVGKRAPIGAEAVRRMVDAVSPEQYEIIRMEHEIFEAAVLRRSLVKLVPQEKLMKIILEEGERVAVQDSVIKAQVNIVIQITRGVDL